VAARVAAHAQEPLPLLVPLGELSYRVVFGPLQGLAQEASARAGRVLVSDTNVAPHWGSTVERALSARPARVLLAPGSRGRTMRSVARVWDTAAGAGVDSGGVIVCAGGGAVTDVAGFAAATWLRGVRYACVPTSLRAMLDASVSGETGVELRAGRDLVGSVHHPVLTWIDPGTLGTLPPRHYRAALAELVSVAAARDAALLAWLEANADRLGPTADADALRSGAIEAMIRRGVQAKIDAVTEGGRGAGAVQGLGFGQTIGRALRVGAGARALHGECAAAGMRAELSLGVAKGVTPVELRRRVEALMDALGLARGVAADPRGARAALRLDDRPGNVGSLVAVLVGAGRWSLVEASRGDLTKALRSVIVFR
jgi:3-dehydroquinate synthase